MRLSVAMCRIVVEDDGRGFEPADVDRVFDRVYTGPGGGSGLDLCIARAPVGAMGGNMAAANRPGGGALVTISIPWTPPSS